MNQETKNKLKKLCFVMEISEEEGIEFCIDAIYKDAFGLLNHTRSQIKEEKKVRDISLALCSPPKTVTPEEKEAMKNMFANFEQIQKECDQDSWMPKIDEEGLEGLEG